MRQPVIDVILNLFGIEGIEVMRRDDALAQLLEIGMICQRAAEFRLAQKQALQKRMRAKLEVRKHPQLFQCGEIEVLAFIDNQQTAPAFARLVLKETLNRAESASLVLAFDFNAESLRNDMDQFFSVEGRGDDLGDRHG